MPGALNGIRVLDMCIILAGPTCGRTLGEYGADVIKIDPEHRKPALTPWLEVGRAKRSICLNITKPGGLDVFYRLLETADVVLEGFRKGVADRLGVGYQQLRERNPGIVYVSINAFGQDGPWAMRPGFDQNAQAATGMQVRNGGRDGTPAPPPYTFNDYGTGLMAAYGVMLALIERERTGVGQRIETSLAVTASTFSSAYLMDYEGFERNEIEGPTVRGFGALSRLYQASDGWFFLSADAEGEWDRLTELAEVKPLRERTQFATHEARASNEDALEAELSSAFATLTVDDVADRLRNLGVVATLNRTMADIRNDADAERSGLIVSEEHEAFGAIRHAGVTPQLSATPAVTGTSPAFGGDTVDILRELGYAPEAVAELRAHGVIPELDAIPLN
ncbi:MAG: CoA transferase [SAR202 cluster bacterium]|jgi:crotonobetainyl-CoA:carnitine CoA-transferase CaiB-like acyl-CoA transferase|nr:CoA transferase [SAR202 cluster bacterium]MDP7104073.1 CoA transferase [SAR202 cluster bacterium]MDP7225685.1 CoA transferase [SAR202 cluster bacterium]|tara:strand:+ start:5048 stop:6223 length:1176 start_codon:yes stop_codon:yes gene_type:complete